MALRNIGVFAHVDAGKTTLSEQLLLHAGAIRQKGSVDSGTAHTDTLPVERRRGISVKTTCVRLEWKGVQIHLIDTPGHVDFSAEVERSLWALDAAVLVICWPFVFSAASRWMSSTIRMEGYSSSRVSMVCLA